MDFLESEINWIELNTFIRHFCNNFPDFVKTTKLYGIRTQHSTQTKKFSDTVDRREDDEMWREVRLRTTRRRRFECGVGVLEKGKH